MPYFGSPPAVSALSSGDISDGAVNSDQIATGAVDLAHMSSQSVDEDNLHISNAGSNGHFLSKQSGDAGGLTWAEAAGNVTDQPFVSVYRSVYTANVTGAGTTYTVPWDTELADTGNDFATPTFTAPSTGFYRVSLFLLLFSLTSAATSARIRLVATGSTYTIYYLSGVPTDVTTVPFSGTNVIKMTAADTFHIDVRVAGESSDVVELDGLKTFSGMTIEFLGNV
jgi:hypothetical protein